MTHQADADEPTEQACSDAETALRLLLLATAGGSTASFAQLYEQTHQRIFGIVLRIVRQTAHAEEILQEVYVKVWLRSAQFDPRRGLVIYWLAGIAQRASIDALRRASSRPREVNGSLDEMDPYDQLTSSNPGPDDDFERIQTQRRVRTQLSKLPADQHESLVMAFFDGLTHHEIAQRLACPLGTIKSRIRRALVSLRPGLQAMQ